MRSDGELAVRVRERVAYREDPLGRAVSEGTRGLEERMEREFYRLRSMTFLLAGVLVLMCVPLFLAVLAAVHDEEEKTREAVRAWSLEAVTVCKNAAERPRFTGVSPATLNAHLDAKPTDAGMFGCSATTCTRCVGTTCIQYPIAGTPPDVGPSLTFTIAPRSLPME